MVKTDTQRPLVLVLNGPNLNMLGQREPAVYGSDTLVDINVMLEREAERLNLSIETFQSNSEGAIVDKIQQALGQLQRVSSSTRVLTLTPVSPSEMRCYCWTYPWLKSTCPTPISARTSAKHP